PHLTLVDQRLLAFVDELDRVFDGEYVARARSVDDVNEGRQGRRFAGSGGPCNENESLVLQRELPDGMGHVDLVRGGNLRGHDSEDGARPVLLHEYVDAKPAMLAFVREVRIVVRVELGLSLLVHDLAQQK